MSYWYLTMIIEAGIIEAGIIEAGIIEAGDPVLEIALEGGMEVCALSSEILEAGGVKLHVWFAGKPDEDWLYRIIERCGYEPKTLSMNLVMLEEGRDWLAENRRDFPPLNIGRFWIYGSHVEARPPRHLKPLRIDAAQAFGSGTHGTTAGCLQALCLIARQKHHVRHILDLGCGSAILGIGAAKIYPAASILAVDNDRLAVAAAAANRVKNHIAARRFKAIYSHGLKGMGHREICSDAPFDLIFANILARPLCQMAGELVRHLAKNGVLVLSGLIEVRAVREIYRQFGMICVRIITIDGWSSLVLRHQKFLRI